MVYTSQTLSLAALETLVHVDPDDIPADLEWLEISIPDRILDEGKRLSTSALPAMWNATPAPTACAALGDGWQVGGLSAILQVPSAILPTEFNYLINPRHPDAKAITIKSTSPFSFDRMIKTAPPAK